MKSEVLFFIVIVTCAIKVNADIGDPIRIRNEVDIIRADLYPDFKSDLPEVFGFRSCGGHGKLLSLRTNGCQEGSKCKYPTGHNDNLWELEFIPKDDVNGIGMRVRALIDGTSKILYERSISDSSVKGGERTIVRSAGYVTEELKGKNVTLQYSITRVDDNNVAVCVQSDYEYY